MQIKSRVAAHIAVAAAIFVGTLLTSATSHAQTEQISPEMKDLIVAAEKEGELLVKWSNGTFGGAQGAKVIENHIREAFGAKIQIKWTPGADMPGVGNEVAIAYRNNQPSPTDVYVGFSRNMATFLKYDMFQKGDYQKYLPDRITPEMVERDTFVRIFSSTIGMSYNKARAPSIPERVSDLLKPEWKGKVATTPFGAGFELLAAKEAWGADKTIDFAKQFTNQLAGFMLCNEADRLASGEFLAFAFDCGGGRMLLAAQKGAPIVRVLVPEVPIVSYFYLAVPKNSQHPNAARLFTSYIMTKQGQKDSWDMNLTDLHLFPESIVAKDIREAEQKYNFKYKEADIAWQEVSNDGGNAALTQVQTILKEKP